MRNNLKVFIIIYTMINKTKIFTYFSSFFGVGILMISSKNKK